MTSVPRLARRATTAVAVLIALSVAGCATPRGVTARASTEPEAERVLTALLPLLEQLRYPLQRADGRIGLRDGCRLGLLVVSSTGINASVRPGQRDLCVYYMIGITDGALQRLGNSQLRAVLAHELGHVHLGHLRRKDAAPDDSLFTRLPFVSRAYDRANELAADEFAARLLKRLEPSDPGACLALASLFDALAERGTASAEWLMSHPSPDRRADRVRAVCAG